MVAVRDIAPLEMILKESPSAVGPYSKQPSGCLQCFRKVPKGAECHKCGFPVCNRTCAQGDLHQIECSFLADKRRRARKEARNNGRSQQQQQQQQQQRSCEGQIEISELEEKLLQMRKTEEVTPDSLYVCITPLRMLLKKRSDPKAFARINLLKDHVQDSSPSKSQINLQLLKVCIAKPCDFDYDCDGSDLSGAAVLMHAAHSDIAGQSRDGLRLSAKRHPQDDRHSQDQWHDPGAQIQWRAGTSTACIQFSISYVYRIDVGRDVPEWHSIPSTA